MDWKNILIAAFVGLLAGGLAGALVGGGDPQSATGGVTRLPSGNFQTNSENLDVDGIFRGTSDDELFYLDAGNDRIGISTSSPDQMFHVDGGANATTTSQFGSGASASSHTCFNLNDDSGNVVSAYISGTSWIIESGACN